ncbi:thioredoxin [Neisseria chenwenguii]|uniref:Thioredoxin n=1 Tax=Neisseria chenwenguii TaxID=1853278 RepID=A0A220S1N9_9NEIS|nr:thioredoxin [Neisseria chenwenguii]ASK27357.1 thioredoxin [Neisseria chenwenguii]
MSKNIIYSNDQQFQKDVLQSELPVLVDFYADWCPPCKMIAPFVDNLADEYAGKAKIVKVNIDENQEIAAALNIRNIPTLMSFKDGKMLARTAGAMPKPELAKLIDYAIHA